jgi:hypothetical protein
MASTYTPIATQTTSGSVESINFTSINGSYTDLVLIIGGISANAISYTLQFNGDTSANYSNTYLYGDGSSATSGRSSGSSSIGGMGRTSSSGGVGIINLQNYSNTTTYKTVLGRGSAASQLTIATVGLWRSTSAITSVLLTPESGTISSGSVFTLYGIKAA